jgi:hypothetical protein
VTELDQLRDEIAKAQKLDSIGMLAGAWLMTSTTS